MAESRTAAGCRPLAPADSGCAGDRAPADRDDGHSDRTAPPDQARARDRHAGPGLRRPGSRWESGSAHRLTTSSSPRENRATSRCSRMGPRDEPDSPRPTPRGPLVTARSAGEMPHDDVPADRHADHARLTSAQHRSVWGRAQPRGERLLGRRSPGEHLSRPRRSRGAQQGPAGPVPEEARAGRARRVAVRRACEPAAGPQRRKAVRRPVGGDQRDEASLGRIVRRGRGRYRDRRESGNESCNEDHGHAVHRPPPREPPMSRR